MTRSKSNPTGSQLSHAIAVLNRLGRTLTAIEKPRRVLEQIAMDARDVLNADIVDLYEYYQGRNEFVLPPVLVGKRKNKHVPKDKIFEDDVAYKVVKAGAPQYFQDAQTTETLTSDFEISRPDAPKKRFVLREGVLSSVSLPLQAGTETVGVMFVNFRVRQKFDEEQRYLIESFSNLAAIAIHNARLLNSRGIQLAALKDIIDVIGTKEEPLLEILKQTVKLFSANNGSISRLIESGQYLQHKVRWADGRLDSQISEEPYLHPVSKGITGHVVKTGLPFRTGNVSEVQFYDPWNSTTRSELAIPLKNVFGGIIGVLNLESDFANSFSEGDEILCESFANAASAAIQQSDLIDDLQSLHYLTESHTLKELLNRILTSITSFMGENTLASVNLYDAQNDFFYAFEGIGPNQELINKYLLIPPRANGTGRYVLYTKTALFYEDINNIPEGLPSLRTESLPFGIVSFAVLPLIYRDEIVGTLFVQKTKEQITFTDEAKRILYTYANQAALAIHNAQRLIDVEPIKSVLSATVFEDRETILKLIVQKTVEIMASDYASIWMHEEETDDLVSQAMYIRPEEQDTFTPGGARIKRDQASVNMSVYQDRKPIIVNDVSLVEEAGSYHRIYRNAKSEIAVPLIFGNEILGTLNAESRFLGAYSAFDMNTLRIFADVAAVAIVNSRTYEQRVKDIAALEEINSAIGRKELDEIYMLIAQKARELTDAAYSILWLSDKESQYLTAGAVSGRKALEEVLQINEKSINGHVSLTKRSYICGDTTQDDYYHQWYPDILSNLTVPILLKEQLIGTLHVESTQKNAYSANHQKLLESLAYQAAIAIENARLFEQNNKLINKKIKNLNAVIEMGKDLTASVDLNEMQVLNLIYEKLKPLMETRNMYIALYDHATDIVRFPMVFIDGEATHVTARKAGSGRTEYIIETKQPLFIATREGSIAWYQQPGRKEYIDDPLASWIGAPMISGDKAIGVIATYHKTEDHIFDKDDLEVLQAIANQSSIALEVTHRVAELKALQGLTDDLSAGLL